MKRSSLIEALFLVWLLISSLYYVNYVFDFKPQGYQEGSIHKFAKYVICFIFSSYFILVRCAYFHMIINLIILTFTIFLYFNIEQISVFSQLLLIYSTMSGFIYVLSLDHEYNMRLISHLKLSLYIISAVAFLEYTVFFDVKKQFWLDTGSFRLTSSLLSPNSAGLYLGALFIIFSHVKDRRDSFLALSLMILTFSRSAYIVTLLVYLFTSVNFAKMFITSCIAIIIAVWLINSGFLEDTRILSAHSGFERIFQYAYFTDEYVSVFPRFNNDDGFNYVQDSFYLMLAYAFGVFFFCFIISFFVYFVLLGIKKREEPFSSISLMYLFSGFLVSFFIMFPNNMLFFISLGAFLKKRSN